MNHVAVLAWAALSAERKLARDLEVGSFDTHEGKGIVAIDPSFQLEGYWGKVDDSWLAPLSPALRKHESRAARLVAAALELLAPGIERLHKRYAPEEIAIVLGSSTGGIDATEAALRRGDANTSEASALRLPADFDFEAAHPYSALLEVARAITGAQGAAWVVSTACSSSGKALAAAARSLQLGEHRAAIVIGADALARMTLAGFNSLGIYSTRPPRPFDATRDGITIGEGAGAFLLEAEPPGAGAKRSLPYFLGAGESNDAYHPTAPHPEGLGAKQAMRSAVAEAMVATPSYINAHGTATVQNDQSEARAIADLFGQDVPFSSSKHRFGHLLGAAGALEAVDCLEAWKTGILPANRKPDEIDQQLALMPLLAPQELPAGRRVLLSNSFAFGGSNVCLALGDLPAAATSAATSASGVSAEATSATESQQAAMSAAEASAAGASAANAHRVYLKAFASFEAGEVQICSSNQGAVPAPESGAADQKSGAEEKRAVDQKCAADQKSDADRKRGADESRAPAALLPARARGRASQLTRAFAELLQAVAAKDTSAALFFGSDKGELHTTHLLLEENLGAPRISPLRFQSSVHNTAAGTLSIALKLPQFSTSLSAGSATAATTLLEAINWLRLKGGEAIVLLCDEASVPELQGAQLPSLGIAFALSTSAPADSSALELLSLRRQSSEAASESGCSVGAPLLPPMLEGARLVARLQELTQGDSEACLSLDGYELRLRSCGA